jgi:OmpA-OmpF porin, OOP family
MRGADLAGAVRMTCLGYTDANGSEQANVALGFRRAQAVCALLDPGVKAKLRAVGVGEAAPRASNRTAEGRALNRRVELRIDYR